MPKKAGTTMWRKQRRKEYLEKKEYRYYIFCEGEQTEPLYFEGFKQLIEDNPIFTNILLCLANYPHCLCSTWLNFN